MRPEGWKSYRDVDDREWLVESGPMPDEAYEAGADAMLEALKATGAHVDQVSDTLEKVVCRLVNPIAKGTLIFIEAA